MSERKVLNVSIFTKCGLFNYVVFGAIVVTPCNLILQKYYPPDFDPSKIPRMKLPRNRQYTVRLMAPFNMR